jgi:polysaccharide export outer membrane protein
MRTRTWVLRLLAAAIVGVGLGLCSLAGAKPPRERDPLPEPMPLAESEKLAEPGAPSTRLEVPSGSDVKITIEILSKPTAPPPHPEPRPPAPREPAVASPAPVARLPLPTIESIQPIPLPPIPDDPPPHEGAMVDQPFVIEPPDLITVEVLEALPGRPISGERLVRPDGMISLSFYGDIYVRGLTVSQAKEKIILHLRPFIVDEVLGLMRQHEDGTWHDVEPKESDRVFVDVTAYNSKSYFVQGDVANPGKLPCTGKETVLDALNYAGGLLVTADPKSIKLVRPARGGKPARVYPIDYEAILEQGKREKNYQLFPDDRIIVGRNPVVKATVEVDRVAAPMQTVFQSILQQSSTLRSLTQLPSSSTQPITAAERNALYKEWVDFWCKIAARAGGPEFDEKTFREGLMKALNPP